LRTRTQPYPEPPDKITTALTGNYTHGDAAIQLPHRNRRQLQILINRNNGSQNIFMAPYHSQSDVLEHAVLPLSYVELAREFQNTYYLSASMTWTTRPNKRHAVRLLLICGYCFFFAVQFNYRYYCIANNFVYKSATIAHATGAEKTGVSHIRSQNTQNPAHLGIDKRFSKPSPVQPALLQVQPQRPSYIVISRKALPPPALYASPDLLSNTLRGPPIA